MRHPRKLGFLSVLAGLLALGSSARAALTCPAPAVDVGTVRAGLPLARPFNLTNAGTAPVEITDVRTACGCLAPRLDRRTLPPGEHATLHVEVNTLTQPAGPHTWRVRVQYRDGDQARELIVALAAVVVAEVTVEPAALVLYAAGGLAHTLTLTDRRATPLTVVRAETSASHVRARAEAPETVDGCRRQAIRLEVLPDHPAGRREATLSLYTNDPDYRELRVPFTVVKRDRGAVTALPAAVEVPAVPSGPPPARLVRLRADGDAAVAVERVEADHPAIVCTWAAGPGAQATLKVRIDPARVGTDGVRGTVRVHLARPGAEAVVIPVHYAPR